MYGGGGNVGSVKVGHNKSIMFGNSCMLGSQTYDENTLVRCVGGKLYPHMGSTTAACTTPLSMPYIVEGAYAWNLTVYSSKPTNSISSAPVYWFDTNGLTPGILSVQ